MDKKSELKRLAGMYFDGKAGDAEHNQLSDILQHDARSREQFRRMELEWQANHLPDGRDERAFSNILVRLDNQKKERKQAGHKLRLLRILSITSSIAAVLLAGFYFSRIIRTDTSTITITANAGQGSDITMPDGTRVHLRAHSRLTYPSVFSASDRRATLTGNAYFDVTHDPDHPFTLSLQNCAIKVRGTRFDVSAPEGGSFINATLISGSIAFSTPSQTLHVTPGETISYRPGDDQVTRRNIDAESYTALMDGKVEYHNVTISELSVYLEQLYGIPIHLDDKLSANTTGYSLRLYNRESFDEVISALKVMLPMGVRYEGDNVWLTAK